MIILVVLGLCFKNFHEYVDTTMWIQPKKGEKMIKCIRILCTLAVALVPAIAFSVDAGPTVAGHNNAATMEGNAPSTLAGWYLGANITSPGSYGGAGACYWTNDSLWLFALNGDQNGSGMALGELRKYNVNTDAWTDCANDVGRAWTSMIRVGTTLYALGGLPNGASQWTQMTGTLRAYNITTNAWSNLTAAPTPCGSSGMVLYQDSLIYAIGGMGTTGQPITNVQLYNVAAGTWRAATALPVSRAGSWAVVLNDTIYNGCGVGPTTSTYNNNIYVGVVNPANHATITWTTSSVTYPGNDRHRMDASLFGGMDAVGDVIIIGPGAGSIWWGTGTDSYTWAGGTSSFTSIGPVQATSDVMLGAGSYVQGIYRKWRFVVASGLVMAAPYHILTVQVYADSIRYTGVDENRTSARVETDLFRIAPNPARGNVVFSLPKHETAKVTVYNASGEKVAILTGRDQIVWKNNLPAGVYFCETKTSGAKETRSLIIVK